MDWSRPEGLLTQYQEKVIRPATNNLKLGQNSSPPKSSVTPKQLPRLVLTPKHQQSSSQLSKDPSKNVLALHEEQHVIRAGIWIDHKDAVETAKTNFPHPENENEKIYKIDNLDETSAEQVSQNQLPRRKRDLPAIYQRDQAGFKNISIPILVTPPGPILHQRLLHLDYFWGESCRFCGFCCWGEKSDLIFIFFNIYSFVISKQEKIHNMIMMRTIHRFDLNSQVLTLVLNVNNNINNNNNNNNNLNINAVDSSNVVANFNTNNANQVKTSKTDANTR